MKLVLHEYYLAYTDGKAELDIPLESALSLGEVLHQAGIPEWEVQAVMINGAVAADLNQVVQDVDEVRLSPASV